MELARITSELEAATTALGELNWFILRLQGELYEKNEPRADGPHWQRSRCPMCKDTTVLCLVYSYYPFDPALPISRIIQGVSFEILDGYCAKCPYDPLWSRLCRIDPTRDPQLALFKPKRLRREMCPHCLANAFDGISRGGVRMGACSECHWLIATPQFMRRIRQNLAAISRRRRELVQRVRQLEHARIDCIWESEPSLPSR